MLEALERKRSAMMGGKNPHRRAQGYAPARSMAPKKASTAVDLLAIRAGTARHAAYAQLLLPLVAADFVVAAASAFGVFRKASFTGEVFIGEVFIGEGFTTGEVFTEEGFGKASSQKRASARAVPVHAYMYACIHAHRASVHTDMHMYIRAPVQCRAASC